MKTHFNLNFIFTIIGLCLIKNLFILLVFTRIFPQDLVHISLALDVFLLFALALCVIMYRMRCQIQLAILLLFTCLALSLSDRGAMSMLQLQRLVLLPSIIIVISFILKDVRINLIIRYIKIVLYSYMILITLELMFATYYFEFINVNRWNEIKGYGQDTNYVAKMGMRIGDTVIPRILGPSLHPITTGYILCFAAIFFHKHSSHLLSKIIVAALFLPLIALSSKGALATYLCVFSTIALSNSRSKQNVLILIYLCLLLWVSSFPVTSGYTHFLALKNSVYELPTALLGNYSGYLFKYDTYLALLLHNFGILGAIYFLYVFWFINKLNLPKEYIIFGILLKVMWLNSILHVEPVTVSSFLLPAVYTYYLHLNKNFNNET